MTDLYQALQRADMLLIDGLHAFDFSLDEQHGLSIECMDGRELKRWHFVPDSIRHARYEADLGQWLLDGESGSHRLICMDAVSGAEEEDELA
ncbi:DUF5629 family protein [Pseudomonas sp. NPDC007930]|uniref:DUF5629 family protein n=1 Tax=Pseudomonas sp. NPDC007930 TaxID=3364417 RepID=UPI0036E92801